MGGIANHGQRPVLFRFGIDSVLKIFGLKDDSVNESMSDEAVYRTAPATPGLLIMFLKLFKGLRGQRHRPDG